MRLQRGPGTWLRGLVALLLALACVAAIMHGARTGSASASVDVVVWMSKTTQGNVQLFIRTESGYKEEQSVTLNPAGRGAIQGYPLRLSGSTALGGFRIDPGSSTGRVTLHRIDIVSSQDPIRLEGPSLRQAVRPLKQLLAEESTGDLSFRSQGADPFLEVVLPDSLLLGHKATQRRGGLLVLVGIAGLLVLLWFARAQVQRAVTRGRAPKAVGVFALTVMLGLAILAALRTGCDGWCSADSVRYGAALLLGALAMAVVGAAVMRATGLTPRAGGIRLFLWVVVGQSALIVYVFLRSALHAAAPVLPLDTMELMLLVLGAAMYLWSTRSLLAGAAGSRHCAWTAIELGLLVVICLVVADRELPRLIMLSSDPDTHAYFARQIELLGGIPWKGETVFNYPGGTAAIGFIWTKLALLDVRNAMTALPLLQSLLAALILGEALALRIRPNIDRLLLMLTALGVTAAGFLIPLFNSYSHMQGTGRQLAIATAAVVPALLLTRRTALASSDRPIAAMLLAILFTLAVLNPVSIVVPIVLATAFAIYVAVAQHRVKAWWLAALLGCPLLLLLDPYYFQLIIGSAPPTIKVTINNAMPAKDGAEILAGWQRHHLARPWDFLAGSLAMARGQAAPMFAILMATVLALRLLLHPTIRIDRAALLAIGLAILVLAAFDGLFAALSDDRRFYLLTPYYAFTLGQLKILLVTMLAASVILCASVKRLRSWLSGCLAIVMVLIVHLGMHSTQKYELKPRVGYCGSLGCLSQDDEQVMRDFEQMHYSRTAASASAAPERVLVPNSVHDTPKEAWVFPITGARALPFYDVPPVAFFYYQGDDDYTTENYKTHVCREFSREWLRQQGIAYVFLPSVRGSACMKGMERLPTTEDILIQHGNSYLLRLR